MSDKTDIMDKWLKPPIVAENERLKARVIALEAQWAHTVDALRAANERKIELEAEIVSLADAPARARSRIEVERLADAVVADVCELPDRTRPEGRPEMMLVTGEELYALIVARFACLWSPAPLPDWMETTVEERESIKQYFSWPPDPTSKWQRYARDLDRATARIAELEAQVRELGKGESREWVKTTLLDDLQARIAELGWSPTPICKHGTPVGAPCVRCPGQVALLSPPAEETRSSTFGPPDAGYYREETT